jgi:hypothetical protein
MIDITKQVIPPGMVKTFDGLLIPRADASFLLRQDEVEKDVQHALDGTVYMKDPKTGALRRMTKKKGEGKKR